jgi:hypothetical protein
MQSQYYLKTASSHEVRLPNLCSKDILQMLTLRVAVGWGSTQNEPSFGGGGPDNTSVKSKLINLINSVRTLMRSESRTTKL